MAEGYSGCSPGGLSQEAERAVCDRLSVSCLYGYQKECLGAIINGKDVFVCRKTGAGKSLCFQGLTSVLQQQQQQQHQQNGRPIVIVISPLVTLMKTQVASLNDRGIPAAYLGGDNEFEDIADGKFEYVYGSAEALVGHTRWRDLITQSSVYKARVKCIAFDEVHTAVTWGEGKSGESPFREDFARVGELRSLIPEVPFLALTATARKATQHKLMTMLSMKCPLVLEQTPDRDNIRLFVGRVSPNPQQSFGWLMMELCEKKIICPKYVIYCRTIKQCSQIFTSFVETLEEDSFYRSGSEKLSPFRLFSMFHSRTPEHIKEQIIESLKNKDSTLRIVIATNALGMGLDLGCQNVILYGPANDFDTYVQQIGRIGRDGLQSHAMLLFYGKQLTCNTGKLMLTFVKNVESCRRKLLLSLYGENSEKDIYVNPAHNCCDVCAKNCMCGTSECSTSASPFELLNDSSDVSACDVCCEIYRNVTDDQQQQLHAMLEALRADCGFGIADLDALLCHSRAIFVSSDIIDLVNIQDEGTIRHILKIFCEVFNDTCENDSETESTSQSAISFDIEELCD